MINKNSKYTLAALSVTSVICALGTSNIHADSKTGQVNVYSLNVRSGPSTSNSVIDGLKQGDKVEILSSKDGWYNVKYGNRTGWVSGGYISIIESSTSDGDSSDIPSTGKILISTAGLNVRSGDSTSYKIIGYVSKNEKVEMLEVSSSGWYKIKLSNGTIGYASNLYLKEVDDNLGNTSDSGSSNIPSTRKMLVSTTGLNVRSGDSTSYKIIGYISKNEKVEMLEVSSSGWYKIKLSNGTIGYASNLYLKEINDSIEVTPDNNSSGSNNENADNIIDNLIATSNLNVRSGPSTSSSIIGLVYKNDNVNIVEKTNNYWYKVKLSNGKVGYCSSTYLKSKEELESVTNKPENSDQISYSMNVKSYAYYTGTITATGTVPTFGRTIAVDPKVIPYGTRIYIPEFDKTFIAEDCGGGIIGNKIDIYMNTKQECLNWGVRDITIYILK